MKLKALFAICLVLVLMLLVEGGGCRHGTGDYLGDLHTVGRWDHPSSLPLTVRYAGNVPPVLKAVFEKSFAMWHQATGGRATFRELSAEECARFVMADINVHYVPIGYSIVLPDGKSATPLGVTEFHPIDEHILQEGENGWLLRYVNIYISTDAPSWDWVWIVPHELGHALLATPDHANRSDSLMWWNVGATKRPTAGASDVATLAREYGQ